MRKILVTGGAGMIGSNLTKALVKNGDDVTVVDNLWRGKLEYLNDEDGLPVIDLNTKFHNIDLSIPRAMDTVLEDIDYVVHLADIVAGIGYVFNNQGSLFRQNILINSNALDSVRRIGVKGYIYIGTACSFPETLQDKFDYVPLKENDLYPAQPESAYGWSKLMGQYEVELLENETDIKTCTLMLHNVYGAPCDYSPEKSQVIPSLIRKAVEFPETDFQVWGSGKQGRAFIHVDDVVNGIMSALENGWGHGHIQLGPEICTSIKDIAETIVDISGKNIDISFDVTKPEGDKARSADYAKAQKVLGWEPRIDIKKGLKSQYDWIKTQIESEKPANCKV